MRFDLSDDEWVLLEPLMPKSRKSARVDDRKIMNAIFYVLRTGMPWRDLPERYGPVHNGVQSVQSLVAAWHLEANLRHVGLEIARQPIFDRQHDRESPPCGQRGKRGEQNQAIGISRGGRSTKIHAIVDSKGRPLNFAVTGGQVHDSQVVGDVLDTPKPPLAITADKAYDSEKVRQQIKDEGALPIIPEPQQCHQESLLSQTLLSAALHHRELLLSHQGLAAYRDALRQACPKLSSCRGACRCTLLDQVVSPDPS